MSSTIILVELREEIRIAIPGIVECLKDSEWSVRRAAINGLSSVAAYGVCYTLSPLVYSMTIVAEFHEGVRIAIYGIVECLKDSDNSVRNTAEDGLISIASHSAYYPLSSLICPTTVVAGLHDGIRRAIPGIVATLEDSNSTVRAAAINVLSSFAAHSMYYHLHPSDVLNYDCS